MPNPSESPDTPSKRQKHGWIYALIFSIAIGLPFGVMEIYFRWAAAPIDLLAETGRKPGFGPNRMAQWALPDAFCAYRAKPGVYRGKQTKTVNQHGFISTPELDPVKSPGTFRIVFLGGSSTAGVGKLLADTNTWPWLVIEDLKRRYPDRKIDFINAALGGYSSFESYGRLWARIRFFSPDAIVVYHGWNEMYYFRRVDSMTTWRVNKDGSWHFREPRRISKNYEPHWIDNYIYRSQVLTRIRKGLSRRITQGERGAAMVSELKTDFDRRGLIIWRANLRLLREAAKILGAELFVAKQATLITAELPVAEQRRAGYQLHGFDHDAHVQAFAEIYRIIDEEIDPSHVIDTTQLSGTPELFGDHVHPTPLGARKIAAIVAAALAPALDR